MSLHPTALPTCQKCLFIHSRTAAAIYTTLQWIRQVEKTTLKPSSQSSDLNIVALENALPLSF